MYTAVSVLYNTAAFSLVMVKQLSGTTLVEQLTVNAFPTPQTFHIKSIKFCSIINTTTYETKIEQSGDACYLQEVEAGRYILGGGKFMV